jgi:hypothetical protein
LVPLLPEGLNAKAQLLQPGLSFTDLSIQNGEELIGNLDVVWIVWFTRFWVLTTFSDGELWKIASSLQTNPCDGLSLFADGSEAR